MENQMEFEGFEKKPESESEKGRRLRDEGIQKTVSHADAKRPGWSIDAGIWAARFLEKSPLAKTGFECGDVRAWAEKHGFPPPKGPRAWGGVLQGFAKRKRIKKIGTRVTNYAYAHKGNANVWVRSDVV